MPLSVRVAKVIDRPVTGVCRFYTREHVRNQPPWDPAMQRQQVSAGPPGVGTTIRRRNTHSGSSVEGTMEVVEFEPDQAMGALIHDRRAGRWHSSLSARIAPHARSAKFVDIDPSLTANCRLVERSAASIKHRIESAR